MTHRRYTPTHYRPCCSCTATVQCDDKNCKAARHWCPACATILWQLLSIVEPNAELLQTFTACSKCSEALAREVRSVRSGNPLVPLTQHDPRMRHVQ